MLHFRSRLIVTVFLYRLPCYIFKGLLGGLHFLIHLSIFWIDSQVFLVGRINYLRNFFKCFVSLAIFWFLWKCCTFPVSSLPVLCSPMTGLLLRFLCLPYLSMEECLEIRQFILNFFMHENNWIYWLNTVVLESRLPSLVIIVDYYIVYLPSNVNLWPFLIWLFRIGNHFSVSYVIWFHP